MAYNEIQQYTLDINWYFTDRFNRICVAASAGGLLPKIIIENDEMNEQFHKLVLELPSIFESKRNENIREHLQGIEDLELYFQNFEELARRGLFVYDKINIKDPTDGYYLLVAYPIYNPEKDSFPIDKKHLSNIPKTKPAVINRFNQEVETNSFQPIDLITILNNNS